MIDSFTIGPFQVDFTPEGAVFRTQDGSDQQVLTYSECYQLFGLLYQNRDELYRLSHEERKRAGDASTYVVSGLTYVIDDSSVAVAGWERLKDEENPQESEKPPKKQD